MKRKSSRRVFIASTVGLAVSSGCGSGPARKIAPTRLGGARFVVTWPAQSSSRLIPVSANSIKLELSGPRSQTILVPRSASPTSEVTFDNLPGGQYSVTATAYPTEFGTGVAQATGTVSLTIVEESVTTETLTMDSTIDRIELSQDIFSGIPGTTVTIFATPRDTAGNVVVSNFSWLWAANGGVASVSGFRSSSSVTIDNIGTGSVTVQETESKKSAQLPCFGFELSSNLLAASAWPKIFGDHRNSCNGVATTGSGSIKWFYSTARQPDIFGHSVVSNDAIYFCTNDGTIHAVSHSGTALWTLPARISSLCVRADGAIYAAEEEYRPGGAKIRCISKTGTILWETVSTKSQYAGYPVLASGCSSPSITSDGKLILHILAELSAPGSTAAISRITTMFDPYGNKVWERAGIYVTSFGTYIKSVPRCVGISQNGNIHIDESRLQSFDKKGNSIQSSVQSLSGYSTPHVDNSGNIICKYLYNVYKFDSSLSLIWSEVVNESTDSSTIVTDTEGNIYCINPSPYYSMFSLSSSGGFRWRTEDIDTCPPIITANGKILVRRRSDGNLMALNNANGAIDWSLNREIGYSLSMGNDGTIYVMSNESGNYGLMAIE